MSDIIIYHNPGCGTSRNTLALLRERGLEPTVIEYLKTPPNRRQLQKLIIATGLPVRALIRTKNDPYQQLGLADDHWTDEQLIEFMAQYPVLINRPIVVTPLGTRLCRPKEAVFEILPQASPAV
ncbi:arsenate reductase (glutaredoxin) [Enterobacteriales bacterium SAP-6]|uniref:Arsenate reductase n=1 Tax=Acerihabitans arboris TaxID=2691583 RepID=A0A845SM07_9GAMM|nr:arsenate reductase (glutaredoxin) [Acerihabitans arboris]NDL63661.1 arsenate reductase (glutaredoxin) [Acerihabitans arboris]